jgi:serine phosphatase RsbU (regulator of sigma subunit)
MELVAGDSLSKVLSRGAVEPQRVAAIGAAVASALAEMHHRGFVHRDIKPSNVIIDASGSPKIIDFGFAQEVAAAEGASQAVGTFQYCSPEQAKMLDRPVDARSDLYSLGCLLFEAGTGRLPFLENDVGALLTQHASVAPPRASDINPRIGPVLAAIIDRLLQKDPDDRYQSADSLRHDLQGLARLEEEAALGARVALGRHEQFGRRFGEVELVGRVEEKASLERVWNEVRANRTRSVQIEGAPGLGKTRLARETIRSARAAGALVLEAKAQREVNTPLGPFRAAIDGYLASLTQLPDDERKAAVDRIREAAAGFAGLIRHLSKSLRDVLGETEAVETLEPEAERRRFFQTTARFFCNLAKTSGAGVLAIDDVQWLDDGSKEVLRLLVAAEAVPLLLLLTARNDEASEPARRALLELIGAERCTRIVLRPLNDAQVGELITAHLGGRTVDGSVISLISSRAKGIPFVVGQLVLSIIDQGLLRFRQGGWEFDADRLREISLPTDVIDLLVARVDRLGENEQRVLEVACVIGYEFDVELLATVLELKSSTAWSRLRASLEAGLLDQKGARRLSFVHDRVHAAVLGQLAPERRRDAHQAIADVLARLPADNEEVVFARARHFAAGHADEHPQAVFDACREAGELALRNYSNAEAVQFLDHALSASKTVALDPEQLNALDRLLGTAYARAGDAKRAREHYEAALPRTHLAHEKASLLQGISETYRAEGNIEQSWEHAASAMRLYGLWVPRAKPLLALVTVAMWLVFYLRWRTGLGYGKAQGKAREAREQIAALIDGAFITAYLTGDPLALVHVVIRRSYNGHALGTSIPNAKAMASYAMLLGMTTGSKKLALPWVLRGLAMAEQLGDPEAIAWVQAVENGMVHMSVGEYRAGERIIREHTQAIRRYSTSADISASHCVLAMNFSLQGRTRDLIAWVDLDFLKELNADLFRAIMSGTLYAHYALLGDVKKAISYRDEAMKSADSLSTILAAQSFRWGLVFMGDYERGELDSAEEAIQKYLEAGYEEFFTRHIHCTLLHHRLRQLEAAPPEGRAAARAQLSKAMRKATLPPVGLNMISVTRCHVRVVKAALFRLDGKLEKAEREIIAAFADAEDASSPWGRWAALCERARIAQALGQEDVARLAAQRAADQARLEGWAPRLKATVDEFGLEEMQVRQSGRALRSVRYTDALLHVSVASAKSLEANDQARAALTEMVRVLGAERGFLFLRRGAELAHVDGIDSSGKPLEALSGYSASVVQDALEKRKAVVLTASDSGEVNVSESAMAQGIRSIMAAPLMFEENALGVIYLDSRLAKGVFTNADAEILQAIGNHIAVVFHRAALAREHSELAAAHEAAEKDLELTAEVQRLLLPTQTSISGANVSVVTYYRPMERCSGDWWWYDAEGSDRLRLWLGDVTAHGTRAAMVMAFLAGARRAMLRRAGGGDAVGLMNHLHTSLHELARGEFGMVLNVLDVRRQGEGAELSWHCAGAPQLIVSSPGSGAKALTAGRSGVLGTGEFRAAKATRPLKKGDRVFVFTDGLSEMELPDGRPMGLGNLCKTLDSVAGQDLQSAASTIAAEVEKLTNGRPMSDDVTFGLLEVQ